MISTKTFKILYKDVNASRMSKKFDKAEHVATICAPSIIVEMIVKKASVESGIEMDWCYFGGRGAVFSLGDKKKSRSALWLNLPVTDLDQSDLCI